MADKWWCVKSPQYGLLPFTAHTERRHAILRFQLHGLSLAQQAPYLDRNDKRVANGWKVSKREGFRCVRITVRPVESTARGKGE